MCTGVACTTGVLRKSLTMRMLMLLVPLALVALLIVAFGGVSTGVIAPPMQLAPASAATPPSQATPPSAPLAPAPKDSAVPASTPVLSTSGFDVTPLSRERVAVLAKKLTPEQFRITQHAGTEAAFCGTLLDNKKDGAYYCIVCGLPLFASSHKFDSGSGWPSFFAAFDSAHVSTRVDASHGMERTEINCARCNAHLGHVFEDGPKPSGLRYCLNGASLVFYEKGAAVPMESMPLTKSSSATETAYFAGGCFWGVEHYFQLAPGVIAAESGYMQGSTDKPTYKDVCTQDEVVPQARGAVYKGHAEVVRVIFDPTRITYAQLLEGFFEMHDPTTLNRQGPDYGTQYRSGLYPVNQAQFDTATKFVADLATKNLFGGRKVVTEIENAKTFFAAEDYHQDYLVKNPDRGCHIGQPWWITKKPAASATSTHEPSKSGASSK